MLAATVVINFYQYFEYNLYKEEYMVGFILKISDVINIHGGHSFYCYVQLVNQAFHATPAMGCMRAEIKSNS